MIPALGSELHWFVTNLCRRTWEAKNYQNDNVFVTLNICRINNDVLRSNYELAYRESLKRLQLPEELVNAPVETTKFRFDQSRGIQATHELFQPGVLRHGEAYLFYQADSLEDIESTITNGVQVQRRSGSGDVWLTLLDERSCNDVTASPATRYVFVVRTALGGTLLSPDFIPGALQHADTVLTYGDQTATGIVNQIRKFAKTNTSQMYPEFLVSLRIWHRSMVAAGWRQHGGVAFGDDARFGGESAFGGAAYQVSPIGGVITFHSSSAYNSAGIFDGGSHFGGDTAFGGSGFGTTGGFSSSVGGCDFGSSSGGGGCDFGSSSGGGCDFGSSSGGGDCGGGGGGDSGGGCGGID